MILNQILLGYVVAFVVKSFKALPNGYPHLA